MNKLLSYFTANLRRGWLFSVFVAIGLTIVSYPLVASPLPLGVSPTAAMTLAYNVDLDMDEARAEKTIEHYGEPVRDIVEDALDNNVNNPDSKPTAENTYERESPLSDILPEKIGEKFSKDDLANMESGDQ
ncbi:hypothetical protein [cf. Phormidesmis sp. LEGE 11477]|uniref:hypothetical protein n=1 Tax=cf. Phormidesmis sp. LEGE 11477 TaxID=1828680 RepID=UPI0018814BC1|nr:hypothetical protein [cf. Phormidesmis sp. LEGE 11477]MBE9062656.1 hypothetical protein [cf. Phormidesmis sp. LEGE 11477]